MTIKIIASIWGDGWAYVENKGKFFLLRSPYSTSNMVEVTRQTVEKAVIFHDFEAQNIEIGSISDTFEYIRDKYLEARQKQRSEEPTDERLQQIILRAPDDILMEFLDRAKNELIPQRDLESAQNVAAQILNLDKVKSKPEIINKALELAKLCTKQKSEYSTFSELSCKIAEEASEYKATRKPKE